MKEEFKKYIQDLKISKVMMEQIESKYKTLSIAADVAEFDEIFVSEGTSSVGYTEYFSLWGFTHSMIGEISLSKREIHFFLIDKNISHLKIEDYNFDLVTPEADSKLLISIRRTDADTPISFNASGINCAHLLNLRGKFLIKHINRNN
jgi:hypothetical protein